MNGIAGGRPLPTSSDWYNIQFGDDNMGLVSKLCEYQL